MTLGKLGKIIIVLVIALLWNPNPVWAGFGMSPGAVKNHYLSPGSHFEQKIIFGRGDPTGDLRLEVKVDAPEVKDWLTIEPGLEFILPDGEVQTQMVVSVDVPKDAELGKYGGWIRVKAIPVGAKKEGAVSVIVGADIRIDFVVTSEEFSDFRIYTFGIQGEEGSNIKVSMKIENLGNVIVAPSKVRLDIYEHYPLGLLDSVDCTEIGKTKPFATEQIFAECPLQLDLGYYWGEVEIFKGDEVVQSGRKYFEVVEKKPLFGKITEIETKQKLIIGGIIIFLLLLTLLIWIKWKKKIPQSWPFLKKRKKRLVKKG